MHAPSHSKASSFQWAIHVVNIHSVQSPRRRGGYLRVLVMGREEACGVRMNPNKSSNQGCSAQTLHVLVRTVKLKYSTYGTRVQMEVTLSTLNLLTCVDYDMNKKSKREVF